jgi:hypothetical protein
LPRKRSIGKHSTYYPEILKEDIAGGHTIGSHTWSHADLSKLSPDAAKEEIEKGFSATHFYAGAPIAPFFRFPDLRHPPEMLTYLGQRNIASFSTDIDSFEPFLASHATKAKPFCAKRPHDPFAASGTELAPSSQPSAHRNVQTISGTQAMLQPDRNFNSLISP